MPGAEHFFLDTNVVLYALGDDDLKRRQALNLLASQPVLSTQVLSEASSVLHRKYKVPRADVVRQLDNIRVLAGRIVPLDLAIVRHAWNLWQQEGFSWFDCLIVSAALSAECSTLFTEDMHHGQVVSGRLTLVNPFL